MRQPEPLRRPIDRLPAALARRALGLRRRLLHPCLDFVLPTDCFACDRPLDRFQRHGACSHCWAGLRPLPRPACHGCALPLTAASDVVGPARRLCAACSSRGTALRSVRACVAYDELARAFILQAKLAGRRDLLDDLGRLLAADLRGSGFPAGRPVLAPVPSHPWSRIRRGFDPAAEIARRAGRELTLELASGLLSRRWLPPGSAKRRSRRERARLLLGAITARSPAPADVLLVDDVMTTGATLEACAAALVARGSRRVRAAVWARAL